ncbi:MAG: sarcosine oxidase subunit alpha [Alphaproteobacteria bacterium]|nr:MAG: sarcosine oxidase subunit alpha [Alphaproteobacteria bacterium]
MLRLKDYGRVNRRTLINFSFDGKHYQGYEGDTLASALMANGVRIVGRSFKYHRPRGIFSAGVEEPCAIVQLGEPPFEEPNVLATTVEIFEGMVTRSVGTWPNAAHDIFSVFGLGHSLLVAGFYYKTFKWPSWKFWSPIVRKAAGLGVIPKTADPDKYDHCYMHVDVLIVGAGPAGLTAALSHATSGEQVLLLEQDRDLGGALLSSREVINDRPALEWVAEVERQLKRLENVTIVTRATACGYYEDNLVTASERVGGYLKKEKGQTMPRERFWHIRAKNVVIATGAIERPLVFPDNDRPGVMLSNAVREYVHRYGVSPGRAILIATNNDDAYRTALDLHDAGIQVMGVVDARVNLQSEVVKNVRAAGIAIYTGHVVIGTKGRRGVRAAIIAPFKSAGQTLGAARKELLCDVVATSGGWSPVVHLHSQSGGKLTFDETTQSFVPSIYSQDNKCIGAANGTFELVDCLEEAVGNTECILPIAKPVHSDPLLPLWDFPTGNRRRKYARSWVDLLHDVTSKDIYLAARENYVSVEHFKRYTATGMAMDQGKTSNINALAILGKATNRAIPQVGTTKFRPPYTPVTLGAMSARYKGKLYTPQRELVAREWHKEHGAIVEDYGGWLRPVCYLRDGESEPEAIIREVHAVRRGVGILDYSPLGKIDVRGPDAAKFLNRFYVNNVLTLKTGKARYGLMLNEHGTIMDDGIFTRLADHHFWVTTTSGGAENIQKWFEEWRQCEWPDMDVVVTNLTTGWGTISLQGPDARNVLSRIVSNIDISKESFPHMSVRVGEIEGVPVRILRSSFTGELGFEINVPRSYMPALWQRLVDVGTDFGITPFGLEALMVLRTEKGYIHIGNDTDSSTIPADVGFGGVARKKTADYIGKRSLYRSDALRGDRECLVGLKVEGNEPLRVGSIILAVGYDRAPAPMEGRVTSSCISPALGHPVALGMLKCGKSRLGDRVKLYDANGYQEAEIVQPCFYDKKGGRVHG